MNPDFPLGIANVVDAISAACVLRDSDVSTSFKGSNSMQTSVADLIYEAAFSPECWPEALASAANGSGCASGVLGVCDQAQTLIGYRASALIQPIVQRYVEVSHEAPSPRFGVLRSADHAGFTAITPLLTDEQLANDRIQQSLRSLGLDAQAASEIHMPSGEFICVSFERLESQGPFDRSNLDALDGLRPHLARASMIAARLRLAQAHSTVTTLAALGLPAAVLTLRGRALATNMLFDQLRDVFLATAFDGLAIGDHEANALYQEVLRNGANAAMQTPTVRSIALAPREKRAAMVLHILPLRRSAHEILSGGDWLLVASSVRADALTPSPNILRALFDLSPAEVKLATAVATGLTLQDAARDAKIQITTARTYLDRIFRKTGTHQQSQLVALLKSAHNFNAT